MTRTFYSVIKLRDNLNSSLPNSRWISVSICLILLLGSACSLTRPAITQHLDELVVVKVKRDLGQVNIGHFAIVKEFYKHYDDEFDMLVIISNFPKSDDDRTDQLPSGKGVWYAGALYQVRNSTLGIGDEVFDRSRFMGSPQKLMGFLHLPYRGHLLWGPTLHELIHLWVGDEVIPSDFPTHWGFSSVHGQLGGFDREKLVELGHNEFTAGSWGEYANYGNSVPYAPLELYLAGWIPPDEVPEILVAENARWISRKPNEKWIFSAESWSRWSIERIIDRIGERNPSWREASRDFKMAVILVENKKYPVTDQHIKLVSQHIDLFTRKASIRNIPEFEYVYNFWEATRGHATIEAPRLQLYRISSD